MTGKPDRADFAAWASEHGWRYFCEWLDESEDPETGETIGGFWSEVVCHEELIGDELHVWCITVGETECEHFEHLSDFLLRFWGMGWERYLEGREPADVPS